MIKTTTCKRKIKQYLNIIGQHKLMYKVGGISCLFSGNQHKVHCVGIHYVNDKPVSCCITTQDNSMLSFYNIAVYTKRSYRQRGLTKPLVNKVVKRTVKVNPDYQPKNSNNNYYSKVLPKQ